MKLTDFLEDIGRPVAYYPSLVKVAGSVCAAIFLCQLIYWRGKESDLDGWIYKTQVEIGEETGLTRWEQESARRHLREKGILKEKYSGVPRKLYFSISLERVNEEWLRAREGEEKISFKNHHNACQSGGGEEIPFKNQHNAGKPHYIMRGNHIIECGKTTCNNVEKPHAITEITTENTTENIYNNKLLYMSDPPEEGHSEESLPLKVSRKDSTNLSLFEGREKGKEGSKEGSKEGKGKEGSPSRELLLFFAKQYEKVFKVPYNINWGKEMKLMSSLLKRYDVEDVKKAIRWYFRIRDDFYFSNGYSFGVFYQKFNAVLLMGRNSLEEVSQRIIEEQMRRKESKCAPELV